MWTIIYLLIFTVTFILLTYFGIRYFVRNSARYGGGRVITCPETGKQAMVEVDRRRAGFTSLIGAPSIQLESCWRWPLNEDCGQECLLQLDVAPPECLVRGVLTKWYKGKRCAFCNHLFDEPQLLDHKPALLNLEGKTIEWDQCTLPTLLDTLETHRPVCWNCHVAQTFRREHPDLVTIRPQMTEKHRPHATR